MYFIAFILSAWLIIKTFGHSVNIYQMPDMFTMHQQIGWIGVFILSIGVIIESHLKKQEKLLNNISRNLTTICETLATQKDEENIEPIYEDETNAIKNIYNKRISITLILILLIACFLFCIYVRNAKAIPENNTHTPAAQIFK